MVTVVWNITFIKYRENKLTVTRYVQNVHHWHEHQHPSVLAIGQLHHQPATAPTLATHAADTAAGCSSSVSWHWHHIYVTCKISKQIAYLQRAFIAISTYVKLLKSIKIFQSYDHKCTATFFMNHCVYKGTGNCTIFSAVTNRIVTRLYTWR